MTLRVLACLGYTIGASHERATAAVSQNPKLTIRVNGVENKSLSYANVAPAQPLQPGAAGSRTSDLLWNWLRHKRCFPDVE